MNTIIQQYNQLRTLYNLELEARVCFVYNTNKVVSNVNVYEFNGILRQLQSQHPTSKHHYFQTIMMYPDNIRQIYTMGGDSTLEYQRKTRILNWVQDTNCSKHLKIKWSLNKEENLVDDYTPRQKSTYIRKKNVHRFDIFPNWQIYLVEAYTSTGKSYEIEIERVDNFSLLSKEEMDTVYTYIEQLFTNRYECKVIEMYNQLLEPNYRKRYYNSGVWPINKPINVKFDMYTEIKTEHNYYLKYDGTRYLVLISNEPGGVYAINQTTVTKINVDKEVILPSNTIFDVEYLEHNSEYYVFDVLIHNSKDVRELLFIERRKILESIHLPKPFTLAPLYTKYDMLEKHILELPPHTDGVIFIPMFLPYKNKHTYKYKPAHLLTIDFLVKDNQLFVNTPDGYSIFKGTDNLPYDPKQSFTCNIDYHSDDILEFKYNADEKKFVALRKRSDKIVPNYITVAQDVWADIHKEINIISFVINILT